MIDGQQEAHQFHFPFINGHIYLQCYFNEWNCLIFHGYLPACQALRRLARKVHWCPDPRGLDTGCETNSCSDLSFRARNSFQLFLEVHVMEQSGSSRFWSAQAWCGIPSCGWRSKGHELGYILEVLVRWKPYLVLFNVPIKSFEIFEYNVYIL